MTFGVIFLGARKCDLLLDMLQSIHDHDLRNLTTFYSPQFYDLWGVKNWDNLLAQNVGKILRHMQIDNFCKILFPAKCGANLLNIFFIKFPDPSGFMSH